MSDTNIDFSMLLAVSGHDIKNVLSSALESLDYLSYHTENDPKLHQEALKTQVLIFDANSQLMQLLSLYKFQNQQYKMMSVEHDIEDFLEMQLLAMRPLIESYNVDVNVKVHESMASFDETLMASALRNALMNSLKYGNNEILIEVKAQENFIEFSISDNGPGFPESMLGKLVPNASEISLSNASTGLGFYFCDKVVKLHSSKQQQGYIELGQSKALGGACMSLFVPRL